MLDISVSGSLGLVDIELGIGSLHPFRLGRERDALDLSAQVMRVRATFGEDGPWDTAVAFTGPRRLGLPR